MFGPEDGRALPITMTYDTIDADDLKAAALAVLCL